MNIFEQLIRNSHQKQAQLRATGRTRDAERADHLDDYIAKVRRGAAQRGITLSI